MEYFVIEFLLLDLHIATCTFVYLAFLAKAKTQQKQSLNYGP